MAIKTYVPGVILVLKGARHYMTKWNVELSQHLTAPQFACIQSTLQAIKDCLVLLGSS